VNGSSFNCRTTTGSIDAGPGGRAADSRKGQRRKLCARLAIGKRVTERQIV
jgi:hypothetical protein